MKPLASLSLWLRTISIRIRHEWARLGSLKALLLRTTEITHDEGWAGLYRRLLNITRRNNTTKLLPAANPWEGVNLLGHPTLSNGVGESLRAFSCALKASQIPYSVRHAIGTSAQDPPQNASSTDFKVNLLVINADEMELALTHLGSNAFTQHYNIGCWMWELATFPEAWRANFRYVDEIWAQSRFVQRALQAKSPVPVTWIPQVVEPGEADVAQGLALGVDPATFNFLFFFDFASYVARKNPYAVIEAFLAAFPDDGRERVSLVIKVSGGARRPTEYQQFLAALHDRDQRIVLIDKLLTNSEIQGLIKSCQCFVSLHRAEGFGRGLAEAMYYGKPVIGTAYSGNMDFMSEDNSCLVRYELIHLNEGDYPQWQGQCWAEPDIQHAAQWMRRLFENPTFCLQLGKRAAQSIRAQHGAVVVGAQIRERLAAIQA